MRKNSKIQMISLLICISTVSFLVYCLIGGILIILQGMLNYESYPVLILTGMWFVLLVVGLISSFLKEISICSI
jgi:hypothetical protein